eukprot:185389-Amorphochlora_amoeboformis.AAC.2
MVSHGEWLRLRLGLVETPDLLFLHVQRDARCGSADEEDGSKSDTDLGAGGQTTVVFVVFGDVVRAVVGTIVVTVVSGAIVVSAVAVIGFLNDDLGLLHPIGEVVVARAHVVVGTRVGVTLLETLDWVLGEAIGHHVELPAIVK